MYQRKAQDYMSIVVVNSKAITLFGKISCAWGSKVVVRIMPAHYVCVIENATESFEDQYLRYIS